MQKTPKQIHYIVDLIVRKYQPEKIVLFGSHAWGKPDRDSDIDLLIVKETQDAPIDRRVAVRSLLGDLRSPIPFDLLVVTPDEIDRQTQAGNRFLQEIINSGITLYAA